MHNKNNQEESEFSELFKQSTMPERDNFSVGDRVSGIAAFITKDTVFVDIAGKSEAVMDRSELNDEFGELKIKVGDRIEAFVVSTTGGEITIAKNIGKGQAGQRQLELAHANEIPVTGLVTGEVKGGYSVSISGIKCFCPFSQFDIRPAGDVAKNFNKNFEFKIIQYTERGRNIILSRKALLEAAQRTREDELKKTLREGDMVEGKITSIRDFGIFVDLGGVEALVPKSEISWGRSPDMSEYPVGKKISAKVLAVDWNAKKISLSLKAAATDPWTDNNFKYERGMTVTGRITNIIKSGAFVELEPGIEGFIHISRMSYTKKITRPEDAVSINENVTVKINEISTDEKKMNLELLTGESDPWASADEMPLDSAMAAIVEAAVPAGLRVRLANGMLGFIPKGELSADKSDNSKKYQPGGELKVCIKEIDAARKNLILSEKEAAGMEERKEFQKYSGAPVSTTESSLGSMFKSQFDDIKKKIETKQ